MTLLYIKFVLDDIHVMTLLLDQIMKSCLVRLDVERNHFEQAKDKLKDVMINCAPFKDDQQ